MKEIGSLKNPLIKEIKKLQQKKYRDKTGSYLLEGFHLVQEAHKAGITFSAVFVSQRGLQEWDKWFAAELPEMTLVSDDILKSLASQPTPQGIIAVAKTTEETTIDYRGAWLLLDNVQDPGNVGTLIRTADAAGFSGVVLGDGSADLYNPKTLRSTQGSLYHLSIVSQNLMTVMADFKETSLIIGTALDKQAKDYRAVAPPENFALVLGNEGQGVSEEVLAQVDVTTYIEMKGQAESLNVAIAGGILMFHLINQA